MSSTVQSVKKWKLFSITLRVAWIGTRTSESGASALSNAADLWLWLSAWMTRVSQSRVSEMLHSVTDEESFSHLCQAVAVPSTVELGEEDGIVTKMNIKMGLCHGLFKFKAVYKYS